MPLPPEVHAEKPNPVIFQAACSALSLAPEQCVHVGDDRRWACAAGLGGRGEEGPCCAVACNAAHHSVPELTRPQLRTPPHPRAQPEPHLSGAAGTTCTARVTAAALPGCGARTCAASRTWSSAWPQAMSGARLLGQSGVGCGGGRERSRASLQMGTWLVRQPLSSTGLALPPSHHAAGTRWRECNRSVQPSPRLRAAAKYASPCSLPLYTPICR